VLNEKNNKVLFCGLTHVGQVFSIGWAEKIGKCAVYDFDQKKIDKFEKKIVTTEEPDLKKYLVKNKKKIKFIKSSQSIKDYKNIFLTLDTPLNLNGKPNVSYIFQTLIRLKKYLRKNANLIITSQVYCGFCDDLKKKFFKDRKDINFIYMAETLVMGNAFERFINPERIILGADKKVNFLKKFKKFRCKIFFYNLKQAELVKMAINLYLYNSVSYANLMDNYCRQFGFKFSEINDSIRSDKRIGFHSYISPSLGISGGHLERDVHTVLKTFKDKQSKNIFLKLEKMNNLRINLLINKFKSLFDKKKYKKIIWVGPSYKLNSFSIINSPYLKFKNYLKKKKNLNFLLLTLFLI
tara:strand:- start:126 stop:1181 length:1056 start_codon:yes stop_codon:yes gene_type:complete